jgi:hypothetical protein
MEALIVAKKGKAPCKHCEEREPGCHGKCARYNEWVDRLHYKKQIAKTAATVVGYEAARSILIDKEWRHKHGQG